MTHNEQIKALIEAGEKATQGEWAAPFCGDDFMYGKGAVFFRENEIGGFEIHEDCKPADNAKFITLAANSRQAIKYMAAENELLKMEIKTLRELREFDRKDIKTMRSVLELANRWFDKAINGDIMSAPDAGLVQRKIDEAL